MKTNYPSVIRRFLSVLLTLCTLMFATPFITPPVNAQATYNVAAAMAYAEAHWNDGQGLCAEFASNVLRAGGLNMRVQLRTYSCLKAAEAASGLWRTELKLTPLQDYWGKTSEMATRELDGDILGAGDLVIQWCHTHDDRPHVIICAGYDDEGYAVYYGHNQAMNKKRFQLGDSMAYMHNHDCDMRAYVLHVSSLDPNASDFDPNASQSNGKNPPPAAQPPVLNVHSASSITQTTVHISGSCSYSGTKPSSVGIYMGTSQESMSRVDSDNINHNKNPFDIWYDLTDLTPGTTYYYQLYAIAGEEEIKTQILSFTTAAQDEPPTIHSKSAKNITPTSVRIEGNCAYSGARPSSVGLYLGTDTASMPRVDSDNINHNKNPFDIWYDLSNLAPGTEYYYQLYAIVNGKEYTSEIRSFRTEDSYQTTGADLDLRATGATKLTSTSVRLNGTCQYGGVKPSSVGLYFGASANSLQKTDSDNINHNKNPFDIWYDLNNLSPSTTYYYQLYAVVDGETYTSTVLSFTTPN